VLTLINNYIITGTAVYKVFSSDSVCALMANY